MRKFLRSLFSPEHNKASKEQSLTHEQLQSLVREYSVDQETFSVTTPDERQFLVAKDSFAHGFTATAHYAVEEPHGSQLLSIKALNRTTHDTRAFEVENTVLRNAQHPALPRYEGPLQLPDGRVAYAMEFVGNIDENGRADARDLAVESLMRSDDHFSGQEMSVVATQLADVIEYLHQNFALYHCDLQPHNILLVRNASGKVTGIKLIDLGNADSQNEQLRVVDHTSTQRVLGTARYLTPERARQQVTAENRDSQLYHSEQFSYGLVLFFLLTGKDYFSNIQEKGSIDALKPYFFYQGFDPTRLPPQWETRPSVVAFFEQILNEDPASRFSSLAEAAKAFIQALQKN